MRMIAFSLYNNVLDMVAPLEARIYRLFPSTWLAYQAQNVLLESRRRKQGWIRVIFLEFFKHILQPSHWLLALFLIALVAFVIPESLILIGMWHLPGEILFSKQSNDHIIEIIMTGWQVLASTIGLTFVIVIFLLEFANARAFENRSFPLFARKTLIVPIVMFEMATLVSLGVNILLLDNSLILQEGVSSLSEYNLLMFVADLFMTILLYVRTFRFIDPGFFRQVFLEYNREQVLRSVEKELQRRIALNLLNQYCDQNRIEFTILSPSKSPS